MSLGRIICIIGILLLSNLDNYCLRIAALSKICGAYMIASLLFGLDLDLQLVQNRTRSPKASWYCFTCASFKGSISLCLSTVSIPSSALVSCCGGWGNYRGSFHGGYCNRGSYGGSCRGCSCGSGSHDGSCGGGSCGGSLSGCGYRKCDHCGATIHTKPWC